MKCQNCFSEVADSVERCPCCGYIFTDSPDADGFNSRTVFSNVDQFSNYTQVSRGPVIKHESNYNSDLKLNIIIAMLGIIILLNIIELFLK